MGKVMGNIQVMPGNNSLFCPISILNGCQVYEMSWWLAFFLIRLKYTQFNTILSHLVVVSNFQWITFNFSNSSEVEKVKTIISTIHLSSFCSKGLLVIWWCQKHGNPMWGIVILHPHIVQIFYDRLPIIIIRYSLNVLIIKPPTMRVVEGDLAFFWTIPE